MTQFPKPPPVGEKWPNTLRSLDPLREVRKACPGGRRISLGADFLDSDVAAAYDQNGLREKGFHPWPGNSVHSRQYSGRRKPMTIDERVKKQAASWADSRASHRESIIAYSDIHDAFEAGAAAYQKLLAEAQEGELVKLTDRYIFNGEIDFPEAVAYTKQKAAQIEPSRWDNPTHCTRYVPATFHDELAQHRNWLKNCNNSAFSNMEGADGKEFTYWSEWFMATEKQLAVLDNILGISFRSGK